MHRTFLEKGIYDIVYHKIACLLIMHCQLLQDSQGKYISDYHMCGIHTKELTFIDIFRMTFYLSIL